MFPYGNCFFWLFFVDIMLHSRLHDICFWNLNLWIVILVTLLYIANYVSFMPFIVAVFLSFSSILSLQYYSNKLLMLQQNGIVLVYDTRGESEAQLSLPSRNRVTLFSFAKQPQVMTAREYRIVLVDNSNYDVFLYIHSSM